MKRAPVPETELRRAKDHLKGSLMLSLENTASRMSHLARQEIYFERHFGLDETLAGVEAVSTGDIQRVAGDLFSNGSLAATVLGPSLPELSRERLGSTLDAWLRHRGRTEAVATALHVHPQTVRYRLAKLRELFGSRLDDPDGRFELELALRARRIAG